MSDDPTRRVARWVGELVQGTLPGALALFLRVAVLLGLAALTMAGAIHYGRLDHADLPGRRGWQGLVVLAVCLFLRAVFELGERDRPLAASFVSLAIFGGMSAAGVSNLGFGDPMVAGLGIAAAVSCAITFWRAAVIWRED